MQIVITPQQHHFLWILLFQFHHFIEVLERFLRRDVLIIVWVEIIAQKDDLITRSLRNGPLPEIASMHIRYHQNSFLVCLTHISSLVFNCKVSKKFF